MQHLLPDAGDRAGGPVGNVRTARNDGPHLIEPIGKDQARERAGRGGSWGRAAPPGSGARALVRTAAPSTSLPAPA